MLARPTCVEEDEVGVEKIVELTNQRLIFQKVEGHDDEVGVAKPSKSRIRRPFLSETASILG